MVRTPLTLLTALKAAHGQAIRFARENLLTATDGVCLSVVRGSGRRLSAQKDEPSQRTLDSREVHLESGFPEPLDIEE